MPVLTDREKTALLCYEGDVERKAGPFWSDPKMYCTWNALLFDGLTTEKARTDENRRLNPEFLADDARFLRLNRDLISALRKMPKDGMPVTAYRVERLADYEVMKQCGYVPSFLSTSLSGFLDSYKDKKQLVLMKFRILPDAVYGNLAVLLPHYMKEEEAEVLIAPYQQLQIRECPLPKELSGIRDAYGQPPAVYCTAEVCGGIADPFSFEERTYDRLLCQSVCASLNSHTDPAADAVKEYIGWKRVLREQIRGFMEGEPT